MQSVTLYPVGLVELPQVPVAAVAVGTWVKLAAIATTRTATDQHA
jgi:hypothetical protein